MGKIVGADGNNSNFCDNSLVFFGLAQRNRWLLARRGVGVSVE